MANNFGKGIKVTSGFDLSAKGPIDNRTVVDTIAQRDAHVSAGRAYEGLKVFVTATQKEYVYTSTGWAESGGITDEQLGQLTAAYAHSMSDHVSNETIDRLQEQINEVPSADSINQMIQSKADLVHNHNELYYDKEQIDQKIVDAVTNGQVDLSNYATLTDLAAKADLGHGHTATDIPGLSEELANKANKDEVVTIDELASKADMNHSHDISNITNLQNALDLKANITGVYNRTELNIKFAEIDESISSKSEVGHHHNEAYYKKAEVDSAIAKAVTDGKVDLSGYATLEDLAGKEDLGHNHDTVYARKDHEHDSTYYKKAEVDGFLANKSESTHAHNDVYYTQSQIDEKISEVLTNGEISLEGYATKKELEDGLAAKTDLGHVHTPSDITGIEDILPDTYTKAEIDEAITSATTEATNEANRLFLGLLDEASDEFNTLGKIEDNFLKLEADVAAEVNSIENDLSAKSDVGHNHNELYYDKTTVENMIETGISGANLEQYATKALLEQELAGKSDLGHGHTISSIENLNELLNAKMDSANAATKKELEDGLATKSDNTHLHNDIYYTQAQVDERIQSGVDGVDLSNLATKSEVTEGLATKSDLGHDHEITEIKKLQAALDAKANKDDVAGSNTEIKDYVDQQIAQAQTVFQNYTDKEIADLVDSAPEAMDTLNELATAIKTNKDVYDAYVETVSQQLESKADINHKHDGIYANATHTHELEDITGLFDNVYTEDEVDGFLASKSDSTHLHNDVYYTQEQVDERIKSGVDSVDLSGLATKSELNQGLASKSDLGHGHDEDYAAKEHEHNNLYFTKDEVTELLKGSAGEAVQDAVTEANLYTDAEILKVIGGENNKGIKTITEAVNELIKHEGEFESYKESTESVIAGKAEIEHRHDMSDVTDLETTIESINTEIDTKANTADVYTKAEVDSSLSTKADFSHDHDISEIKELQSALDSKASKDEMASSNENVLAKIAEAKTEAETYAKNYTDQEIAELIDSAPEAMNTLKELANAIDENKTIYDQYIETISQLLESKADINHKHDGIYAKLEHTHELEDLIGLEEELDGVHAAAVSEAVGTSNNYTDAKISEVIGGDGSGENTLTGLNNKLTEHVQQFEAYKGTVTTALAGKTDLGHGHEINKISGLQDALDLKANKSELDTVGTNMQKAIDDAKTEAETYAKNYTDKEIAGLVDSAPEAMNTLNELATAIKNNKDIYDAYVNNMSEALANKSDLNHTHSQYATKEEVNDKIGNIDFSSFATKAELSTGLETKSDISHNHDDLYSALEHVHDASEITDLNNNFYNKDEIGSLLANKSDSNHKHDETYSELNHEHVCADIADLAEKHYTKTTTDELLTGKADVSHNHDTIYYRKYLVDAKINALGIDGYAKLEDLNRYALKDHTHDNMANVTLITDTELNELLTDIYGFTNNESEVVRQTFNISYYLIGGTATNNQIEILEGDSYYCIITPLDGYTILSAQVAMNEVIIDSIPEGSYTEYIVDIPEVTGNIVITVNTNQLQ